MTEATKEPVSKLEETIKSQFMKTSIPRKQWEISNKAEAVDRNSIGHQRPPKLTSEEIRRLRDQAIGRELRCRMRRKAAKRIQRAFRRHKETMRDSIRQGAHKSIARFAGRLFLRQKLAILVEL